MKQNSPTFQNVFLMTLLGGAALGGFAVAFTATKTGKEFRNSLRALANRINPRAGASGEIDDEIDDEIVQAVFI